MRSLMLMTLVLIGLPCSNVFAQCTAAGDIVTCLNTDTLTNCLAAQPTCSSTDVNNFVTAKTITDNATAVCCAKKSKGARQGCLSNAIAAVKTTEGKTLLAGAVRTSVSAGLKTLRTTVAHTGKCPT